MGNSPSAPRTNPSAPSHHEPARAARRDSRHPRAVHNHQAAALPEESLAQAQGTPVQPVGNNLLKSFQPRAGGASVSSSSVSSTPASATHIEKVTDSRYSKYRSQNERLFQSLPGPVPIPNSHGSQASTRSATSDLIETAMVQQSSVTDLSYMTRPPRLPLPIEEEVHTPGSPIIAPAELSDSIRGTESLDPEGLPRQISNLSSSSGMDEEDNEELRVDKTRPTVPTRLEWLRGGDKVYVTGTIFQWNRKTRLHPVEGRPGIFSATINILPGTHHVRFLVDGQMQTSPDLPTTVDFGNNLVNYIEVNPEDALVGALDASNRPAETEQAARGKQLRPLEGESKEPNDRTVPPANRYSHRIPVYLQDFDQPADSPLCRKATSAIDRLPKPPSLPGFLGKPILNAATLIKDDNSVLNMPNHTVLNHLATCSIKDNVLAVSATTRYKSKCVTTIIYKPTDL